MLYFSLHQAFAKHGGEQKGLCSVFTSDKLTWMRV